MAATTPNPYSFKISPSAGIDLGNLELSSPHVHMRIVALFQELRDDHKLLGSLLDDGFGEDLVWDGAAEDAKFTVKYIRVFKQGQPSRELWRLKMKDLEEHGLRYRIVYMYVPSRHMFIVLAIVPRSWNYAPDSKNSYTARIKQDYDSYSSV